LFRQDLYYRLNVIEVRMPSLRECREDVPALASGILARLAARQGSLPEAGLQLSEAAIQALLRYDFPGNVRELENILERALALSGSSSIEVADLCLTPSVQALAAHTKADLNGSPAPHALSTPTELGNHASNETNADAEGCAEPLALGGNAPSTAPGLPLAQWLAMPLKAPLQDYLDAVERAALEEALVAARYNRTRAAEKLGLTFRSLRYRLKRLGIE
jgi:two-component system response regulator PilR (NtrC family)